MNDLSISDYLIPNYLKPEQCRLLSESSRQHLVFNYNQQNY